MNFNNIVFFDFETGGKNPHMCQPLQLSAICIDARRLNIVEGSLFNSYIQPVFSEEECAKFGIGPVEDEALEVNKIKPEQLKDAPTLKVVWNSFCAYTEKYKKGKGIFGLPIRAGYNINGFDNIILDRIMGGHNAVLNAAGYKTPEPWGFGPWDDNAREQRLFNPRDCIDMMPSYVWPWTENNSDMRSISMLALREWLGISHEYAHNAIADVITGATILIRFMKLTRSIAPKVKFEQSLASENESIKQLIEQYLEKK